MKLLLVFAVLALVSVTKSVPTSSSSSGRGLILPQYSNDDEVLYDENVVTDVDDQDEASPSTTTTTTSRRSTNVLPTRTRYTFSRQTQRTTTMNHENDDGNNYFKNVREMFKKIFEDIKKFVRKITENDIIKTIIQYFNKNDDD